MIAKKYILIGIAAASMLTTASHAVDISNAKIAVVNFKTCVESSKLGQQEQANFDKMKKQMEDVLAEREKTLKEVSTKMNDDDYVDSLSKDAQSELKHKFRSLNQEIAQQQQHFYQVLQQANFKIIQKVQEEISEASKIVAKNKKFDVILNEEGAFFYNPSMDISNEIVRAMDDRFSEEESKK